MGSALFTPLELRSLHLQHRGWVSPMCQYSCEPETGEGVPNDWHLMHLGSFATGGAALILTEAAAVNAAGRISPRDAGLYNDDQAAAWERITAFVHRHGTGRDQDRHPAGARRPEGVLLLAVLRPERHGGCRRRRLAHRGSRHLEPLTATTPPRR